MRKRVIVVGNGMVGYKFCQKLVEKGGTQTLETVVFGEEPRPAYDRVHLSEFFSGKAAEALTLAPLTWYAENQIHLYVADRVMKINREEKMVISERGRILSYDKLVLATGSTAFVPPVPGMNKAGVFVYRTIEDLEAILAYGRRVRSAAVIGGGLLGLEAAKAMLDMGLKTHVVEFAPYLMARQLDATGAHFLKTKIEALGVEIHLNKNTKVVLGENTVTGLGFEDGGVLPVDMVVVSAGIRPRDDLARLSGLEVGGRGGILVNDQLQTSDPDIYAIGECALHQGMIYGLVAPGYRMAEVVTAQILGNEAQFKGADLSTQLKLLGVDVASFGQAQAQENVQHVTLESWASGLYKKLVVSPDGKRLLGGILVGDASDYNTLLQMYHNATPLPEAPESLLVKSSACQTSEGTGVGALPASAIVCSCENVSKATMVAAIQEGTKELAQLKKCTKGGTGCGGCVPLMKDLLNHELKAMGMSISAALCEHFPHSRRELRALIRHDELRSYPEVLAKHGKGRGCEVCKPAVASMLAGIWNEPILKHPQIQDTNDFYLANMQKNGTYSVVPRVPGGEITPEQLILIGQVAKDFRLYTKITGGQRIDLFGAKLEDLPQIWERLIAGGFESGHAYGKALRTVKSCVGWTWCRFGVQDSTAMAIEIENRYKGLRAPHKIKGAVSGCSRECAEAQSKDFGVIATEKGWNLYVCGNGGMKPQHAVLLAADLDHHTLIQYLDRFLMYYIRTAEHLTRTATWLNKLEGGLHHLREVVVHDQLGIAAELEAEMQKLVEGYECEWANALHDPEKRKRFRPFLNNTEADTSIQFMEERGQIRPYLPEEKEDKALSSLPPLALPKLRRMAPSSEESLA